MHPPAPSYDPGGDHHRFNRFNRFNLIKPHLHSPKIQLADFLDNLDIPRRGPKHLGLHPGPPARARSLSSIRSDESSTALIYHHQRRHQPGKYEGAGGRGRSPPPAYPGVFDPLGPGRHLARHRAHDIFSDDDTSDFDSVSSDTIISPDSDFGHVRGRGYGHRHSPVAHRHFDDEWVKHLDARDRALALAEAKKFEQRKVLSPYRTEVLQNEVERRWERDNEIRAREKMLAAKAEAHRIEEFALSPMWTEEEVKRLKRKLKKNAEKHGSWDLEVYARARRSRREQSVVQVERFKGRHH